MTTPQKSELEKLQEYEERLSNEIQSLLFCDGTFKKLARLAGIHSDCLKYMAHLAVSLQPKLK